jgi:hypothetical protein
MSKAATDTPAAVSARAASDEARWLREENVRLREAIEDALIILGNPAGYCENDRTEVAHAVARIKRGLQPSR